MTDSQTTSRADTAPPAGRSGRSAIGAGMPAGVSEPSDGDGAPGGRGGALARLLGPLRLSRVPMGILAVLASVALILLISMPAMVSMRQNESAVTRLLGEKGSAMIVACETILRSGMRSQAGVRLQMLLEELGTGRDILFIAVTMPDGTIVAHSNRARVGETLTIDGREIDEATMRMLAPKGTSHWGITRMEGKRAFVVYRQFLPPAGAQRERHARPAALPIPMIFLGMDIAPFEATHSQDRNFIIMVVGIAILLGLACLAIVFLAERARQSRSLQRRAEGRVRVLEEEMRRKEKLAAIGNLAAGVAHEIRNPLSSIKGFATYFQMKFPEGSEDRKAAAVMVNEVERLNRVITELIGLSRPTDVRLRATPPGQVVEHVTRLVSRNAENRGVTVHVVLPKKLPLVMADPDRLGQALLNLCLNALDAMPGGGVLTLEARPEKGRVCLLVEDTGTGIPPEQLTHIFDPYFTTKAKGTGIGLATVHKIVEAIHGEIAVESRVAGERAPGGTTFRVWLPAAPEGAARDDAPGQDRTRRA